MSRLKLSLYQGMALDPFKDAILIRLVSNVLILSLVFVMT